MTNIWLISISGLLLGLSGVHCDIATTGGNANGANCVFPYTFQNTAYRRCITNGNGNTLWCATTNNYDTDSIWGNCQFSVTTTDGEGCIFPFLYQGRSFSSCTTENANEPWCATTSDYDTDQDFGYCETTTTSGVATTGGNANGKNCVFPYIYQGTSYSECITAGNGNTLWCATTANYDTNNEWGNCVISTVATTGGNANGKNCVFPFVYQGTSYSECITAGNGNTPWCATTANYDTNQEWGNCVTTAVTRFTVGGQRCAIPFEYNGRTYTDCTKDGSNVDMAWCSLDRVFTSNWGHCRTDVSTGGRCGTWEKSENTNYYGGTYQDAHRTEQACLDACLADTTCLAIDYSTSNDRCYFHNDATKLVASNRGSQAGVHHSRLTVIPCVGVTGRPGCDVGNFNFAVTENKHGRGGVEEAGVGRLGDCQSRCAANANCLAIDFRVATNAAGNNGACWLHLNANNLVTLYDFTGVNHYKKEACTPGTDGPGGTGGTQPPDGCVDGFTVSTGTAYYGGVEDTVQQSISSCENKCRADTACEGFDYSASFRRCWYHRNPNYMNRPYQSAGITHHKRDRCGGPGPSVTPDPDGCVDSYVQIRGRGSLNGRRYTQANSVASCQAACTAQRACNGIDYSSTGCYLHDLLPRDRVNYTSPTTNQWNRVRCDGGTGCVDTFLAVADFGSDGGELVPGVNSLDMCEAECRKMPDCYGLDFDSRFRCYAHKQRDFISKRYARGGVTQLVREFCECTEDRYARFDGRGSQDGVRQPGLDTIEECRTACNARSATACYGFDFNTLFRECYLHGSPLTDESKRFQSDIVSQFVREPCEVVCVDDFSKVDNTGAFDGEKFDNYNTVEQCQDLCRSRPSCTRLDFNTRLRECWLHTTNNVRTYSSSDVTHYIINRCDPDRVTPDVTAGTTTVRNTPQPGCRMDTLASYTLSGGEAFENFNGDQQACLERCLRDRDCRASHYDRNRGRQCFKHTSFTSARFDLCCVAFQKICQG